MRAVIPETHRDMFERPVVAALATVMPDGQPQVNPVWVDYQDGLVVVNTARGRQKERNLRARPRATILLVDPENPYRYLEVRGAVVAEAEDGARDHIDAMARKYMGADEYPNYDGETRVLFSIEPQRVTCRG